MNNVFNQQIIIVSLLISTINAYADLSATLTAASDDLSYGVSQTNSKPSFQGSLNWSNPNGLNFGILGKNIKAGEINREVDLNTGYGGKFNDQIGYELNMFYYTYYGEQSSDQFNYGELNGNLVFSSGTTLGMWYAWDYSGSKAGHYTISLIQELALTNNLNLKLGIEKLTSLDQEKYDWFGKKSYQHYFVALEGNAKGFDLSLSLHDTNVNKADDPENIADTAVVFSIARTFDF